MSKKPEFYREVLAEHGAMWGDQYALTMSQAFFTNGKHDVNTTFHAYIRKAPFDGSYLITGGQNIIMEWLTKHWEFNKQNILTMRKKMIPDPETGEMKRLYSDDFIDMVENAKMELTIDMMPEGELAFADEPIFRVHGPLWQCLMVEAAILNTINSQSLFATLASRLVEVADGGPILEFGLRRAQAVGGLEPTRGSFIGGITATSNMLAEEYYDIPTSGTFAHALVMTYEDELQAFKEYAGAMPYNGIFLVDTYDTIEGVKKAIKACKDLGIRMKGIRLDSGDLAHLSIEARKILDGAGFEDAKIAASNDLDEDIIKDLTKVQGAKIDIWGVGTNLVTSKAQPALGAVYKLGAVFDAELSQNDIEAARKLIRQGKNPTDPDFMREVIKLSEQSIKVTIPGELDVIRHLFTDAATGKTRFNGDTIVPHIGPEFARAGRLKRDLVSVPKDDETNPRTFNKGAGAYRPLIRVMNQGVLQTAIETVHDARERAAACLAKLEGSHKRLKNPHRYGVGIEEGLYNKRKAMISNLRPKKGA